MELTNSEKVEKAKKPAKRRSLKGIKVLLAEVTKVIARNLNRS